MDERFGDWPLIGIRAVDRACCNEPWVCAKVDARQDRSTSCRNEQRVSGQARWLVIVFGGKRDMRRCLCVAVTAAPFKKEGMVEGGSRGYQVQEGAHV